jgi:type IV pilus assembly protein PilM
VHFYKDKPVFGLDIGHGTLKVMQLEDLKKKTRISGYGIAKFDIHAIDDEGVIVDYKPIATAMRDLFKRHLVGQITTRRAAIALPSYRTFSRSIQLPKLNDSELHDAVALEVEQYIPIPMQDLYLDYMVTARSATNMELFVVAVPKKIVDSYLVLAKALGLEVVLVEPAMASCARLFANDSQSDVPAVIIDFGSLTADISIYNKNILATGTVAAGGLVFTEAISKSLRITLEEAGDIKTKYGLDVSKVQKEVRKALDPSLQKMVTEIRRVLRYYDERYAGKNTIGQVIMLGGGSNMPGLGNYLTDELKMPVRTQNHPWASFEHEGVRPPAEADRLMFATVAGLSLLDPEEVFRP